MSEFKTNKISPRKGTTTTIGDSGDTITIPSGVTLSNSGTINGIQEANWQTGDIKTTAFTATAGEGYFCNTTSAAFTVTLPASPSAGAVVGLKDYADTFDTNNLTINSNGNKIQGSTDNFIISVEGTAAILLYVDSTKGWLLVDQSKASDIAEQALFVTATGGTVTTSGDFKIHTFTGPGTLCVSCAGNPLGSTTVDYLIVAGGGGGGFSCTGPLTGGGGGGGAGFRTSATTYCGPSLSDCVSALPVTTQGYPITIGAGGAQSQLHGNPGSNSVFSTITSAAGGGGGGYGSSAGKPGGSGSGSAGTPEPGSTFAGGSGNTPPVSPPQGNDGGSAPGPGAGRGGAGGGGATAIGSGATPGGGSGGAGAANAINGSSSTYSVGAPGAPSSPPHAGTAGGSNTGNGGGGSKGLVPGDEGAAGGSGIVIIRYKFQ